LDVAQALEHDITKGERLHQNRNPQISEYIYKHKRAALQCAYNDDSY